MRSYISIFLILIFIPCNPIYSQNKFNQNDSLLEKVKTELSSDFFRQLYSNTYYSLIDRIEKDGYFQESLSGQYDGMYCRTVGALIPLLIETKNYSKAELLLKFIIKAMKDKNMDRLPHVIGKTHNSGKDSVYIIGKTDQIDGQAHFIFAWAKLALKRGQTPFEDSTWTFVSELMNRSTEEPYFGRDEAGCLSSLVYNFSFEHSRSTPTNYDLLTQCFVGSSLNSMIELTERRKNYSNPKKWRKRLIKLKSGIGRYMTRILDGKKIYLELLLKKDHQNEPFSGFSWVNLSPIAAQWEPLDHSILFNTIKSMQRYSLQNWNDITWMPTQWNPDNTFSGQMIGKGIGWELEFSREEKDWQRVLEILNMLKTVQIEEPIFMENSYLTKGSNYSIPNMNSNDIRNYKNGIWKIVDAGNGEQAAWWCWAIAKMRNSIGLSAKPLRLYLPPAIKIINENSDSAKVKIFKSNKEKIYYTIDGTNPNKNSIPYKGIFLINKPTTINIITYKDSSLSNVKNFVIPSKYKGLEFTAYDQKNNSNASSKNQSQILSTGYSKNFRIPINIKSRNNYFIIENGFIKITRAGNYRFYLISEDLTNLSIDNKLISSSNNKDLKSDFVNSINLNKSFHKIKVEFEPERGNKPIEIYFSINGEFKKKLDPNMLLTKLPNAENILRPQILPSEIEFDKNEELSINIKSFDNTEIFYTTNGKDPTENSIKYKGPFQIIGSTTVKAISKNREGFSPVALVRYKQTENPLVKMVREPSQKYYANGDISLIDGIHGTKNSGDGNWLGFEGEDLDVTIDLRKLIQLNEIKTEFLNNPGSWIFLPREIKIYVSGDGKKFEQVFYAKTDVNEQREKIAEIKSFGVHLDNTKVKFIRLVAYNIKVCPKWHPGDGNKAWLFIDEISYD